MNVPATVPVSVERVLKLPVWIVFERTTASDWEPSAAFVSAANRDAWCNTNKGTIPQASMQVRWGNQAQLFCSRTPCTILFTETQHESKFVVNIEEKTIPVVDLDATPEAFSLLEHTSAMLRDFLHLQSVGGDKWTEAKTLLRALTEEHVYLSPLRR